MRAYVSCLKEFCILLIFCIFFIFVITFLIQLGVWIFYFFKGGVFGFGVVEFRKSVVAGVTVGSIAAVGIWIMSLLEKRKSNKDA